MLDGEVMQSMTPSFIAVMNRLKKMNLSTPNSSLFCTVCQVHVSSESVMEVHVKGKKHSQLEQIQRQQAASVAKSVYVRGFPPGSTADQLTEFFQQFGTVNKVIVDREYGQYAIIEFNEDSTADSVLSKSSVFMNNSRLTIRPRQMKGIQTKRKTKRGPEHSPQKHSSSSSSTSATTNSTGIDFEKIREKLSECNTLEEEMDLLMSETSLSSDEVIIRQNILRELEAVLQRTFCSDSKVHLFGSSVNGLGTKGCDLDLFLDLRLEESSGHDSTSSKVNSKFGHHNVPMPRDDCDSVVQVNNNSVTCDNSVTRENDDSVTCENDDPVTCENDDSATCENDDPVTCENDNSATCENDDSVTCENDESATCENDDSVTCENDDSATCENDDSVTCENNDSATCENDTSTENQISVKEVTLSSKSLQESIKTVSNLLRARRDVYAEVVRVTSARCPVVKFVHLSTSLKCDLSINNRLALRNTSLIQFLLSIDARIRPLVFSVRQWARVRGVAGQLSAGSKLTNYALTMIVFFYLQTRSPPILPSVDQLSHLAENHCVFDGWDCSFTSDSTKLQTEANVIHLSNSESKKSEREPLEELLRGFFEFYATLDFSLKVISLRVGKTIYLNSFSEQMTSDPRLKDFKISPLMVQDPFVLNHNIASNVSEKSLIILQTELKIAATKCRTRLTCPRPSLISLFSSEPKTPLAHPPTPHLHEISPTASDCQGTRATHRFTVKVEASKLMAEALQRKRTFAEMQDEWYSNAVTIVWQTLKIFDVHSRLVEQPEKQTEVATPEDGTASCHSETASCEVNDRIIQSEKTISDLAKRPSDCETHDEKSSCPPGDRIEICLKGGNNWRKRYSSEDDEGNEHKRPKNCSEQNDSTENNSVMQSNSTENSCMEKGSVELSANVTDEPSSNTEQNQETGSQMTQETENQMTQGTGSQMTQEIASQLTPETASQMTQKTASQMTRETASQMTQDTASQMTQEIASQLTQKTVSQMTQETGSQLTEETVSQMTQETGSQMTQETASQMTCPVFSAECSTRSRLWLGRKKLRKELSHLEIGDYEREVQVSRILSSQRKPPEQQDKQKADGETLLKFKILLSSENSPSTALTVSLETDADQKSKDLSCFFFSFRYVVERLVDKYGMEDIGEWKKE